MIKLENMNSNQFNRKKLSEDVLKVRTRPYFDAGLDTVGEIAKRECTELIQMIEDFIERTGFNGTAPLPKEAATAVATAKYIDKIVEY